MKKVELKTKEVSLAYEILNVAKYQKLSDDDKVKVWKISRKLFPIAEKYGKDMEDAKQKIIPSEDYTHRVELAIQYQNVKDTGGKELPMTDEEYARTLADWNKCNNLIEKALKELAEQNVTIEIDAINEEAFGKLMASNDWNFAQVSALEFIIE